MVAVEGMTEKKKGKFLHKTTRFGTKELTLYSLDGVTWSTRKDELQAILDRHEAERLKLLANMGEAKAQEEAEKKTEPKEEKDTREEEGPMIVEADADIDLDDEEMETEDSETEEEAPKVAAKKAAEETAVKAKPKKSTRQQKGKEKVAFVTPKPRQIAKKLKKASKSKKRAAA